MTRRLDQTVARVLVLPSADVGRAAPALLQAVVAGSCWALLMLAAYSAFLSRLPTVLLAPGYIVSGLLGYLTLRWYAHSAERWSSRRTVRAVALLLVVTTAALWALLGIDAPWPAFVAFVTVAPVFGLLHLERRHLALLTAIPGRTLNLTAIAAAGVAHLLAALLVPLIGDARHLLLAAVALAVAGFAVARTAERGSETDLELVAAAEAARPAAAWRDRYSFLLAALFAVAIASHYLLDYAFLLELDRSVEQGALGAIDRSLAGAVALARYLGLFFAAVMLVALVVARLFAGRSARRFGIRAGLAVLPTLLVTVVAIGFAIPGPLRADVALVLGLVMGAKLLFQVLRQALFDPAFRLLYQPLDASLRPHLQTMIEGPVQQAVIVVTGLVLLAAGLSRHLDAVDLLIALSFLAGGWIVLGLALYRRYRRRLLIGLAEAGPPPESPGAADLIGERLRATGDSAVSVDPDQAVALVDEIDPASGPLLAAELLAGERRGDEAVRLAAVRLLMRHRGLATRAAVEAAASADPASAVRHAAGEALAAYAAIEALAAAPARLAELRASTVASDRRLAAQACLHAGDADGLEELLWDRDGGVRRAALRAAGEAAWPQLWPRMVAHLGITEHANVAVAALAAVGEPVLDELEEAFARAVDDIGVRLRVLEIYRRIGGERTGALLVDKLRLPTRLVRRRVLRFLGAAGEGADAAAVPLLEAEVEGLVAASGWNLAALEDLGGGRSTLAVRQALQKENRRNREKLFALLTLLLEPRAVARAREMLATGGDQATYAIEVLDTLLAAHLKPLVLPIVEGLPASAISRRLEGELGRERLGRRGRLRAIVQRDPAKIAEWTKACALATLAEIDDTRVEDHLACLFHPRQLLREVAAWNLRQLRRDELPRTLRRLAPAEKTRLERLVADEATWTERSLHARMQTLLTAPAFAGLPWDSLLFLAATGDGKTVEPGSVLPAAGDSRGDIHVVVSGGLLAQPRGPAQPVRAGAGELIAFAPSTPPLRVVETTQLLRLDRHLLMALAADHGSLALAGLDAAQLRFVGERRRVTRASVSIETHLTLLSEA